MSQLPCWLLREDFRNECLIFFLDKTIPKDYANLLTQAHKYAQIEEAWTMHQQVEGGRASSKKWACKEPHRAQSEGESS